MGYDLFIDGVYWGYNLGVAPLTVTVTTRIITFLVGNPYKPSFPTVTGRGPHPSYNPLILTFDPNFLPGTSVGQVECSQSNSQDFAEVAEKLP